LPRGHECCAPATLGEHLTVRAAGSCARRYLATPLDEIILAQADGRDAREGEGNCDFPGLTRVGWGNRFAMDAETSIEKRLPSRRVTVASCRRRAPEKTIALLASGESSNAALHLSATTAQECEITFDQFDVAEIFKKTLYIADLKPGGRDVAKDLREICSLPLLKKTLLDNGQFHGDCPTVAGRTIAENLKSVRRNPRRHVARCADTLNVKLTAAEPAERKTKWQPRQTNHTSGRPWKYARAIGPAVDGAVTHPGGAHEKQCYANI
jgi:hypothetical protein